MTTPSMSSLAARKNRPMSCRRPCARIMPRVKTCFLSAALMVYCWMMTPEAVFAITKATCEQTYGHLGNRATIRCAYEPSSTDLILIEWKKGPGIVKPLVYSHEPKNPNKSGPEGEFTGRNVTTKDGVAGKQGFNDIYIYESILGDEDVYQCNLFPSGASSTQVLCPRLTLPIPPTVFNLSWGSGSNFRSVPEIDTDCTNGGITINTSATTTLRYVTASRPSSNITWNQVTDGSSVHTPYSGNTVQTTFQKDVTMKQGDTKLVKFTITSQNPNFTAGPLVKEACIKLHYAGGSTPPGHKPGELAAIIVGSLAAVALISGGVALAMWKMRLACWKNTVTKPLA